MLRRTLLVVLAAGMAAAASAGAEKEAAEKARPADVFMGEYTGQYTPAGGSAVTGEAKVVPDGDGKYRVVLLAALPAEKAGGKPRPLRIQLNGKVVGDKVTFAGKVGKVEWSGTISADKKLTAKAAAGGRFELAFTVRKSPTEGAKPPPGAVVLLPMTEGPPPLEAWTNRKWKALPGGVMQIARGGNNTVKKFGDVKLHIEFMTPYEPKGRGQGRGNSGVYLMGRYEVQVLDSFGLLPRKGDCGAIYGVAVPKVNASLPPLRWQTYDVTFRAPRIDKEGKLAAPGRISVLHNGIEIHKDVQLKGTTRSGARGLVQVGPLHLQDHGHPVKYRNIWIVELPKQE